MSDAFGRLMEKNLLEVFRQQYPARRAAAIAELYAAACTFFEAFEAEGQIVGRDRDLDTQCLSVYAMT